MIVPRYWAEAREQGRLNGRNFTVRRFGWSDESAEAAATHAAERAREAVAAALAGELVPPWESRVTYGGTDGLPIREEIVEQKGDAVVTRNTYGARCLNTPDVLFADVDFADLAPPRGLAPWLALGVALATAAAVVARPLLSLTAVAVGALAWVILKRRQRWAARERRGLAVALERVRGFVAAHPGWVLRLYRTPVGLRVVAVHRRFSADEPAVTELFAALGADRDYVRLCRLQRCFRARLSAKPWRIGITDRLRPRPGVWPITDPEKLDRRREWVGRYEARARGFAACRFLEEIGDGLGDPRAADVVRWHDELSRARSELPLA